MILKSFEIENNIKNILKYKFILIYGENIGLKEVLKKKLIDLNSKSEIINLYQEDITKNKDVILNEVKNISLFAEEKIIVINQANEKNFSEIQFLIDSKENIKIILVADLLDKRSKLRNLFEKESNLAIIPCYNDNDITLRKLIQNELKDFKNLNSNSINMILAYSNFNRKTILNNLEKIKTFYEKKTLFEESLEVLLNSDRNEIFENIRDAALNGEKTKLNNLLANFTFANEDAYLYLNMINYRLIKLLDIYKQKLDNQSFEVVISKIRPPIFWKDKPIFIKLLNKWDKQRVIGAIKYLGQIEQKIKTNSSLNTLIMVKNSITNICTNSWTYF
tara:strand:- start:1288 stop:2289 length:1002 start_codon:yes stop_codon:yes gene_type:complete